MQTKILLSIKPEFADKIFDGSKLYEFRRVLYKSRRVTKVIVYASSPVKRIIGEFTVDEVLSLAKDKLWEKTRSHSGIEKEYFDRYFDGLETASAIKIKSVKRYSRPKDLGAVCPGARPPQSFFYM